MRLAVVMAVSWGAWTASAAIAATPTVRLAVKLDPAKARAQAIPPDFAGLSMEMQVVRAAFNKPKGHWLSAANTPFVTLFKTIGVRSLRIGGNTTERNLPDGGRPLKPYPADADAAAVNDFAHAIGATQLIWCLPVAARFDPTSYSDYAARMVEDQVAKGYTFKSVFQLGNEPDLFKVPIEEYPARFDAYSKALEEALGERALYCGPSAAGQSAYPKWLATAPRYQEPALRAHIPYVTHHWYPGGGANAQPNVEAAIAAMLAPAEARWLKHTDSWARAAVDAGFRVRLDESNSMYNGGYAGASDAYAAALWAFDYLSFFAHESELDGIHLHNASTAQYNAFTPPRLADSYTLQGIGYGLLAFAQNRHGRPVPRTIQNPDKANVTAYALLHEDGTQTVRLINKTNGANAADATVTIDAGNKKLANAKVMYLAVEGNDPAAKTGITLGGKPVEGDGSWSGQFTQSVAARKGKFEISVPQAQAAVVHLY